MHEAAILEKHRTIVMTRVGGYFHLSTVTSAGDKTLDCGKKDTVRTLVCHEQDWFEAFVGSRPDINQTPRVDFGQGQGRMTGNQLGTEL